MAKTWYKKVTAGYWCEKYEFCASVESCQVYIKIGRRGCKGCGGVPKKVDEVKQKQKEQAKGMWLGKGEKGNE